MLRLDQIKNGPKELIMMLTLKNIQISQQENLTHLIQLKKPRTTIDIAIHSMLKLHQIKNGLKELTMMLIPRNILNSLLVN
jgi:ubiquinone biosynthesis protein COQ9